MTLSKILLTCLSLMAAATTAVAQPDGGLTTNNLPDWALGGFVRPSLSSPVLTPKSDTRFYCPMHKQKIKWEESDVFNPASTVYRDKLYVLYRAEDNSATGIGKRTSRIGLAQTTDGINFRRAKRPVLYPADDAMKAFEWPGGCEDPRVVKTADGTFVMTYTSWNRKVFRLCVATSRDLKHWTKHGPVFAKCFGGRFKDMACKSASILTKVENGDQVVTKLNGKYFMYWGERHVHAATSDNLVDWTPVLNPDGKIAIVAQPRKGFFDSGLTECGPPAVLTDKGIVLIYNGKNRSGANGDRHLSSGTYSAGQLLTSPNDPMKVIGRLDKPFLRPMADYERAGQYTSGTVFVEGLSYYKGQWYLYYGCADSLVGVAVYNPNKKTPADPYPQN